MTFRLHVNFPGRRLFAAVQPVEGIGTLLLANLVIQLSRGNPMFKELTLEENAPL